MKNDHQLGGEDNARLIIITNYQTIDVILFHNIMYLLAF